MDDEELVNFIIIFFALGIIFNRYYPALFEVVLITTALVGATYFLLGTASRLITGATGKTYAWGKDWWHGLAILLMVGLVFGRMDLAVKTVWIAIVGVAKLLAGLITLSL